MRRFAGTTLYAIARWLHVIHVFLPVNGGKYMGSKKGSGRGDLTSSLARALLTGQPRVCAVAAACKGVPTPIGAFAVRGSKSAFVRARRVIGRRKKLAADRPTGPDRTVGFQLWITSRNARVVHRIGELTR